MEYLAARRRTAAADLQGSRQFAQDSHSSSQPSTRGASNWSRLLVDAHLKGSHVEDQIPTAAALHEGQAERADGQGRPTHFGGQWPWQLHVDARVSSLMKSTWHNPGASATCSHDQEKRQRALDAARWLQGRIERSSTRTSPFRHRQIAKSPGAGLRHGLDDPFQILGNPKAFPSTDMSTSPSASLIQRLPLQDVEKANVA